MICPPGDNASPCGNSCWVGDSACPNATRNNPRGGEGHNVRDSCRHLLMLSGVESGGREASQRSGLASPILVQFLRGFTCA
jgi:hypothetical protein